MSEPHFSRRIATPDLVRRNRLRDDRARPDHRPVTYLNAFENDRVCSDPDVRSDPDRVAFLGLASHGLT